MNSFEISYKCQNTNILGMDDNIKRTNIIKGVIGLLVVALGLGIFFAFRSGLFSGSVLWVFIAIIGGVVVLVLSGILFLPRARINKTSRSFEFRTDQHDSDYNDFVPSRKYKKQISEETRFCDYCGVAIKKREQVCTNCGQKLD